MVPPRANTTSSRIIMLEVPAPTGVCSLRNVRLRGIESRFVTSTPASTWQQDKARLGHGTLI